MSDRKGTGRWHTSTIKGITYEIAPDGTRYAGTAAEVREARLTPTGRAMLADSIRSQRIYQKHGLYPTHDEYVWQVQRVRREAIRSDYHPMNFYGISTEEEVAVDALARLAGITSEEFIASAIRAAIAANGPIAYTRHERAALDAIREREYRKTAAA